MTSASSTPLEIPLRKGKLALFLVMALGFVVVAIGLIMVDVHNAPFPAWLNKGTGILGVVFFGPCAAFFVVKLLSRAPGLLIDQEGIVDDMSYTSVGRIEWSEITGVRVASWTLRRSLIIRNPPLRFLVIDVRNPQRFIDQGNWLQRLLRRGSAGMVGSPVTIPGSVLRADLDDLARRIREGASVS